MTPTHGWFDRLIEQADQMLRTLSGVSQGTGRPSPGTLLPPVALKEDQRKQVTGCMRVNHAGEIMAQALYFGQMLSTTPGGPLERQLRQAALEETDHLIWCRQRLHQLGSHTSVFDPLWYFGALALGGVAGALGSRTSLGFTAEVEEQVHHHLQGHIDRLPPEDQQTCAILVQMQQDESQHKHNALAAGGMPLPPPVRHGMRLVSKVMTTLSYYV